MGFFCRDGFETVHAHATRFAGEHGRIATMPDVVDARLADKRGGYAWSRHFDTMSSEFFGYTRSGLRVLIVAHGVGPLATIDGQRAALDFELTEKDREKKGGRISQEEFLKLESGHYGDVSVVPYTQILRFGEYTFTTMRVSEAIRHPLVQARLGSRYEEYLERHAQMAIDHHRQEASENVLDPYIVDLRGPSDAKYHLGAWMGYPLKFPDLDAGEGALAHKLTIMQLVNLGHQSGYHASSLSSEIRAGNPAEAYRYIAIREGKVGEVQPDFGGRVMEILMEHPEHLSEAADESEAPGFYRLMEHEGRWFTHITHEGHAMAVGAPEYMVGSALPVGNQKQIMIEISGYYGLYEVIKKHLPEGANAFKIVSADLRGEKHHECIVQFFNATVDTSRKLWSIDRLAADYDTLMQLSQKAA